MINELFITEKQRKKTDTKPEINLQFAEAFQEEKQVTIHIHFTTCYTYCNGCRVMLHSNSYLLHNTSDKKSTLISVHNIPVLDSYFLLKNGTTIFTLIFEGLPKDVTHFDFIEPVKGGWNISDIERNNTDIYNIKVKNKVVKIM